jgi:hypothetical protein
MEQQNSRYDCLRHFGDARAQGIDEERVVVSAHSVARAACSGRRASWPPPASGRRLSLSFYGRASSLPAAVASAIAAIDGVAALSAAVILSAWNFKRRKSS